MLPTKPLALNAGFSWTLENPAPHPHHIGRPYGLALSNNFPLFAYVPLQTAGDVAGGSCRP